MSANKPVEHQRIDSDCTQPKSVENSLSSLPDLSKFGLSAPYPKTLIKQIAPETIVEEEVQQQPVPESIIEQPLEEPTFVEFEPLDLQQNQNPPLLYDYQTDPIDTLFINQPTQSPDDRCQNSKSMINRFFTKQHSYKSIPLQIYFLLFSIAAISIYCLIIVILDHFGLYKW